jgi:DNA invertase Pin-like site-specific DNA recombinase
MSNKAFSYIRVSTAQQGRSGLGIEAQRQALRLFTQAEGIEVLGEYVEVAAAEVTAAACVPL